MAIAWNESNAAHLLRRATFAATPKGVAKAVNQGFEKTLQQLLKAPKPTPKPPKKVSSLADLQAWWIGRMLASTSPLAEKMTLFWHNHFATAISKVANLELMHRHVATLAEHALGNFKELLEAVAKDPAMLIWLDNRSNFKDDPNENFARELMELFTTGVLDADGEPNYTEDDVVEVARAFTGWTLKSGQFFFDEGQHDFGSKTVKGVSGNLDGGDVLDLLNNDPATTRRIPARLFSYFGHPIALDDPVAIDLEAVFVSHNGELLPVVEALFRHEAFYSEQAKAGRVKSPAEFLVGALVALDAKLKKKGKKDYPSEIGGRIQELGQSLYDPPDVFGWDEGQAWVPTAGLLARAAVGDWLAEQREPKHSQVRYDPARLLGKKKTWKDLDAADVVDLALAAFGVGAVSATTVAALVAYVEADPHGIPQAVVVDDAFVDQKLRGLVALILASPEYQMA